MIGTKKEILHKLINSDDEQKVYEIKEYKQKRSLNANNLLWLLVNKLAIAIKSTADEVYISMLKRYSECQLVSVKSEINVNGFFKYYEEAGKSILKGQSYTHYKIYLGSSEMNTKQMSRLIDGVIDECKALDIETMPEEHIKRLKEEWRCKVAIEGSFLGMLTAISNIIEAVNERMRKKGMNEEDIKKALKASFETGIEATDE